LVGVAVLPLSEGALPLLGALLPVVIVAPPQADAVAQQLSLPSLDKSDISDSQISSQVNTGTLPLGTVDGARPGCLLAYSLVASRDSAFMPEASEIIGQAAWPREHSRQLSFPFP
jgi:hypothetical protein